MLGYDDKGVYLTETKEHELGEPKGGKLTGEIVTRRPGKEGPIGISQIPSYIISQLRGIMPIQVQYFLGWLQGEIEMFDAIGRSAGAHVSSTYPTEKSIVKTFVEEYVDIKKKGKPFNDLREKVDEYNERQELRGEEGIPVSWSTIVKKGLNIVKTERAGERRTEH